MILILPLFLLLASVGLWAQTFSGLSGTVQDASKAVVAGAQVTVRSSTKGYERTTQTDDHGFYSFPNLEADEYTVRIAAAGFQSQSVGPFRLNAASSSSANVTLSIGKSAETVEVSAEEVSLALDKTSTSIGDTVTEKQLDSLPVNGRDYARLSLITPGAVARSRYISDISFDGAHTVHNQFSVDGVDASRVDQPYMANGFERGARLLTGSLETIQEFRAQTSGYPAEYGRAAGSLVNIVTKSGSNLLHGTTYDYFRNEALDAHNYFARDTKPRFRFNDFGGNLSGPLYRDRTFFFGNYEGSRQTIGIIGTGSVLSNSARSIALAAHPELAPILNAMPTVASTTTASTVIYKTVSNTQVTENTGSIRIDHKFTPNDPFFVRVNVNDSYTAGPLFGVTTTALGLSDHQSVPLRTTNIAVHEQHIFNSHVINDALIGLQRWASRIESAEDLPQISISGVDAVVGSRGDSISNNNSYQWGDNLTLVHGRHTLKGGATVYRIQINRKNITTASVSYASIAAFEANTVLQVTQSAGDPGHGTRATQVGGYLQDSWQLAQNFVVNYGLRYDWATDPHDKDDGTQAFDPRTGALMSKGQPYFNTNFRDFSPRLGFSWSPLTRTVVKLGTGIFYQAYPVGFGAYYVPLNTISGNWTLTQTANPGLSYPYASYVASATAITPTGYGFPTSKPDIYTTQWNLSVAQDLGRGAAVQVGYVGNHGVNLWRRTDINLYKKNQTVRPNTAFGSIYLENNNGFSGYNGFQLQYKQRIGKQLNATANYSWGHVIDDVQDQGLYSSNPQNNDDLKAERGNGSGDIRHNLSYSLNYQLPIGKGHALLGRNIPVVTTLASGWSINSLGILRSGVTSSVAMSGINTYGNLNYTNQRPDVVAGASRYVTRTLDSNGYVTYLNRSAWSRPATGTFGNSRRNTVYGAKFTQIDFAALKDTHLSGRQNIQFRAEIFNLLNHANFGFPNVAWTPTSATFGTISSTFGNTLGFGTARQVQFAVKYQF
jgi:hypothetical protein